MRILPTGPSPARDIDRGGRRPLGIRKIAGCALQVGNVRTCLLLSLSRSQRFDDAAIGNRSTTALIDHAIQLGPEGP